MTLPIPPTVPDIVRGLDIQVSGRDVTVRWTAPQDDGGSSVNGYIVLRGLSSDILEEVAQVDLDVNEYKDPGLKRGTTYHYTVVAKNDVGNGEAVATMSIKVPKEKNDGPAPGLIAAIAAMGIAGLVTRRRLGRTGSR